MKLAQSKLKKLKKDENEQDKLNDSSNNQNDKEQQQMEFEEENLRLDDEQSSQQYENGNDDASNYNQSNNNMEKQSITTSEEYDCDEDDENNDNSDGEDKNDKKSGNLNDREVEYKQVDEDDKDQIIQINIINDQTYDDLKKNTIKRRANELKRQLEINLEKSKWDKTDWEYIRQESFDEICIQDEVIDKGDEIDIKNFQNQLIKALSENIDRRQIKKFDYKIYACGSGQETDLAPSILELISESVEEIYISQRINEAEINPFLFSLDIDYPNLKHLDLDYGAYSLTYRGGVPNKGEYLENVWITNNITAFLDLSIDFSYQLDITIHNLHANIALNNQSRDELGMITIDAPNIIDLEFSMDFNANITKLNYQKISLPTKNNCEEDENAYQLELYTPKLLVLKSIWLSDSSDPMKYLFIRKILRLVVIKG